MRVDQINSSETGWAEYLTDWSGEPHDGKRPKVDTINSFDVIIYDLFRTRRLDQ